MNRNNITVLRKERRRDRRSHPHLEARLDGREVILTDLSTAGFGAALDATDEAVRRIHDGQRVVLELMTDDGGRYSFAAEVSRLPGATGVVGAVFEPLDDAGFSCLEGLVTGRHRRR